MSVIGLLSGQGFEYRNTVTKQDYDSRLQDRNSLIRLTVPNSGRPTQVAELTSHTLHLTWPLLGLTSADFAMFRPKLADVRAHPADVRGTGIDVRGALRSDDVVGKRHSYRAGGAVVSGQVHEKAADPGGTLHVAGLGLHEPRPSPMLGLGP
jgi:hypothetical protein